MLFFLVIGMTIVAGRRGAQPADILVSHTPTAPSTVSWELKLDRIGLWTAAAIALILITYGPFFLTYLPPLLRVAGVHRLPRARAVRRTSCRAMPRARW